MVALNEVVSYLDSELRTAEISDYAGALNGLQLANEGEINHLVAAVDASLPVIKAAANAAAGGLLIVHHGMFWQGAQPVTGHIYRKLKAAIDAGLAVYSSHLPLDIHPEFGNNVLVAKEIGLAGQQPFLESRGNLVGIKGKWDGSRDALHERLEEILQRPVHLCPGGPERVSVVGVITGGAGSEVAKVFASGVDTFVTGEGPHWSYPLAEELGLNILYGGHYATETFGVRALAKALAERFRLPWQFVDHPTGL